MYVRWGPGLAWHVLHNRFVPARLVDDVAEPCVEVTLPRRGASTAGQHDDGSDDGRSHRVSRRGLWGRGGDGNK